MAAADRDIPWDRDVERIVLGAMMHNTDTALDAADHLRSSDFHWPQHAALFDAITAAVTDKGDAGITTLPIHLRQTGQIDAVGGVEAITDIWSSAPVTTKIDRWTEEVIAYAKARGLIGAGIAIADIGYTAAHDVDAAIEAAEAALYDVTERRRGDPTHQALADTIDAHIEALEAARHDPDAAGIRTGFHDLDNMLGGGLRPGQLVIVAARPGMGKSVFAGQTALNASENGHPAVIVSLEMSRDELSNRLLANVAGLDLHLINARRYGDLDMRRLATAAGDLRQLPLDIDDNASATLLAVRAAARRTARRHGRCDLVIVDYLQLMSTPGRRAENRQVEVADLSRGLKLIARDLQVPVVALSQLNRGVESRLDKRPMLADLRESGAIENDADIVIGLYRDEVYHQDSKDRGTVEALILKQRMGPTGMVRLGFLGQTQRITNLVSARGAA